MNGVYEETVISKDLTAVYKGALAEQFTGQELLIIQDNYRKAKLYYWTREAKNSHAEIDFLIELGNKIIPVEVKAGAVGKMKSMRTFIETYNPEFGIRISQAKYDKSGQITSIPFYGIGALRNLKN